MVKVLALHSHVVSLHKFVSCSQQRTCGGGADLGIASPESIQGIRLDDL